MGYCLHHLELDLCYGRVFRVGVAYARRFPCVSVDSLSCNDGRRFPRRIRTVVSRPRKLFVDRRLYADYLQELVRKRILQQQV